ncbi:MAG: hypothetical protein BMS9Abin07_1976 [Acidimicrobiia bacterium]|nr:MAG: hypothetical protein BMS9Abin07_1976 [Acidimicrobiia bacterium]
MALVGAVVVSVAITRWVPVATDEAWFLEVVRRVRRGDRLYEDVFFGAGPVAVWLAMLAVSISRPQIVVMRSLTIAYGLATWVAGAFLLEAAGAGTALAVLFVVAVVALGGHHLVMENHYGQLSTLGTVIAAVGVLEGEWLISGAGVLLALSGKYSLGVFALAWAVPLLAVEAGLGTVLWMLATVVAGVVVMALGLSIRGVKGFLSTAVANKGVYLSSAIIWPHDDLIRRLRVPRRSRLYRISGSIGPIAVLVVAGLGVVGVILGLLIGVVEESTMLLVAGSLCATGLLVAFPRADYNHLVAAMPLVLAGLSLIAMWSGLSMAGVTVAGAVVAVVLVAGLLTAALAPRYTEFRRDLAHLKLLPVPRQRGTWPDDTAALRAVAGDEVFVLRPDASFFYLAGRLRNPTPYDYPLASTFGPHGQERVAAEIVSGAVRWVCQPGPIGGPLAPVRLEQLIAGMTPVADTPVGSLYGLVAASND